jgi:hypothetical protein
MSTSPVDSKKRSEADEKNVDEISSGLVGTIAEDTVEAAHQCMLVHPVALLLKRLLTLIFLTDTDADFRRIRFKTDLYLMPLLWILGGLCKFSAFKVCIRLHLLIFLK